VTGGPTSQVFGSVLEGFKNTIDGFMSHVENSSLCGDGGDGGGGCPGGWGMVGKSGPIGASGLSRDGLVCCLGLPSFVFCLLS